MTLLLLATIVTPLMVSAMLVRAAAASGSAKPALDLNGSETGTGYNATFTEDEGQEPIVDPVNLIVSDGGSGTIAWARATLTTRPDAAEEALTANAGATGLSVKYTPDTGVLSIKGSAASTVYEQVLRTLSYENLSQNPDVTDRVIEVLIHNGVESGDPATSTVAINSINDAPILDNLGDMSMKPILENETDSPGNTVDSIILSAGGDRITDVDGIAEGIAVVEVGNSNGTWQYSLNGGVSWAPFVAVSNNSAVLLNLAARVRFVPNPDYTGSASLVFRAWDQTSGASGGTGVDVSQNGGSTPFSKATETVLIEVQTTDQPPVVDLNGLANGIDFAASFLKGSAPVAIAAAGASVADADDSAIQMVTVTLTNRPDGAAELLAAKPLTTSVTIIPYDAATGQLKLQGPESAENFGRVLRTVTYHNAATTLNVQPRLIQVSASDASSAGPPATSTITLYNQNQAPVLNPAGPLNFMDVAEDTLAPQGQTLASMLVSAGGEPITDADPNALEGIAVVGLATSHGVWQFAADGGAAGIWQPFGPVSENAAVLLAAQAGVRFIPAANFAGSAGGLTFRAWDQTAGANGQAGVDTTTNGGSSAFSAATATATVSVTPINDPPTIQFTPPSLVYVENSAPISLFDASLDISDVDSPQLASAAVRLLGLPDGTAEVLSATAGGSGLQITFVNGVLTLQGVASPATYETVLRSVTYHHLSQDPTAGVRQIELSVADALDASAPISLSLDVQAVNDPPIVDLNGASPGVNHVGDFFIKWGPVPLGDNNLTVSDVDNTRLQSMTVTITNPLDEPGEFLDGDVSLADNISKSYDPATGILALTGLDSLANYQAVLRSVTYNNVLPDPSTADRTVNVMITDSVGDSASAVSVIRFNPTPTASLFLPLAAQRGEEPNDACAEAFWLATNRAINLLPDDVNDWFYFDTTSAATITVELRSFEPAAGQLVVASGRDCKNLKLLGSNGDDLPNKDVRLGQRPAGRFYIWVINDGPTSTTPYTLRVRVAP